MLAQYITARMDQYSADNNTARLASTSQNNILQHNQLNGLMRQMQESIEQTSLASASPHNLQHMSQALVQLQQSLHQQDTKALSQHNLQLLQQALHQMKTQLQQQPNPSMPAHQLLAQESKPTPEQLQQSLQNQLLENIVKKEEAGGLLDTVSNRSQESKPSPEELQQSCQDASVYETVKEEHVKADPEMCPVRLLDQILSQFKVMKQNCMERLETKENKFISEKQKVDLIEIIEQLKAGILMIPQSAGSALQLMIPLLDKLLQTLRTQPDVLTAELQQVVEILKPVFLVPKSSTSELDQLMMRVERVLNPVQDHSVMLENCDVLVKSLYKLLQIDDTLEPKTCRQLIKGMEKLLPFMSDKSPEVVQAKSTFESILDYLQGQIDAQVINPDSNQTTQKTDSSGSVVDPLKSEKHSDAAEGVVDPRLAAFFYHFSRKLKESRKRKKSKESRSETSDSDGQLAKSHRHRGHKVESKKRKLEESSSEINDIGESVLKSDRHRGLKENERKKCSGKKTEKKNTCSSVSSPHRHRGHSVENENRKSDESSSKDRPWVEGGKLSGMCVDTVSRATGRGSWFPEELQQLAQRLGLPGPDHLTQICFRVEREKMALMLGANDGSSAQQFFQNIMDKTGTHIFWPSRLPIDGPRSRKSPVIKISGLKSSVSVAKSKVTAVLDSRLCHRVTMKIGVSYTEHAQIIGRSGHRIKRIKAETGCVVHFPNSNRNSADWKSNQVSICGEMEGVERARCLVRELTPLIFSFELPPQGTVPNAFSPFISRIQERYNVHVAFSRSVERECTLVVVKGCEWQMATVKHATLKLVQHLCPSAADKVTMIMTLQIFPQQHQFVKGTNHQYLKRIVSRTGAKVDFPDYKDPDIPQVKRSCVTISGGIDSVYLARQQLIGMLPLSIIFQVPESSLPSTATIDDIMVDLTVIITTKTRPNKDVVVVTIKGREKNASNIYEARRQLLGLKPPAIVAAIPATYYAIPTKPQHSASISNLDDW